MSVLINFKICDNAKECNGIAVCPTGALYWDARNETIKIDNSKCISCGKCEKACMVEAIHVAVTNKEYEGISREIARDPRKISDLFVDRYGAKPIHPAFLIDETKFNTEVSESVRVTVAELFSESSIMCLLRSIPIKELFRNVDIKYRKVELKSDALTRKYGVKQLPALLFFKDGKFAGKVEGYLGIPEKTELMRRIHEILDK